MKNILATFFCFFSLILYAQKYNTGNIELDTDLETINAEANLNFGQFKTDLSIQYNIAKNKIEELKTKVGMTAGDIYIALEIAKITKKPIDEISTIYRNNKEKGWGVIAKEAGIKPGSKAFHELKKNAKNKNSKGKDKKTKENGKKK